MCSLCLNQELSTIESKPRMVFHHPAKGNAASEETSILEKLPKFDLPGESLNRRRYLINPLTSLGLVEADCLFALHFTYPFFLISSSRREDANPRCVTESPVELKDRSSGPFQTCIPSAFSKLNFNLSFSPPVPSQGSWSSR